MKQLMHRLLKAVGVGGLATLVDLITLTALVEFAGLAPAAANVPALLAGAVVQFIGCRHIIFDARSGRRSSQLAGFAAVEGGTLLLNGLLFVALLTLTGGPYALVRIASTFLVFVGFSFPAWHWVFKTPGGVLK